MELSKLRKLQNSLKKYSVNMIFNSFLISEEELQPTGERTRSASGRRATHCSKCGKPKWGHKKGQCAWNTDTLYFLVTWTEHACQVSNYFLPEISLRPGIWLKHLLSVLKIVVTTDILITESFSIHFYSFSFAFSSQDAATINLFMFVFLTTCRPINLCSDFCCWSWLLLPVVAPKGAVVLLFKTDSPINYHHLRTSDTARSHLESASVSYYKHSMAAGSV